jgi:hypothetical protein
MRNTSLKTVVSRGLKEGRKEGKKETGLGIGAVSLVLATF